MSELIALCKESNEVNQITGEEMKIGSGFIMSKEALYKKEDPVLPSPEKITAELNEAATKDANCKCCTMI